MTSARTLVSSIIMLVVVVSLVVGLGSLAYPSVQVTVFRTETFSNTSSYAYPVAVFTAFLVPYSTTRALHSYYYEPGNFPGCDPTAMGCNYGFPNYAYYASSTSTYSGLSTSSYQTTIATQSTITSTLTKTSYKNVPMYTALGLNDSQFTTLVMFAILLAVAIIFGILLMTGRLGRSRKLNKPASNCIKCGTELMPNAKFCGKCGTAS